MITEEDEFRRIESEIKRRAAQEPSMTTLRQAAQQALEALEFLQGGCTDSDDGTVDALTVWCPEVITALRKALEQPEQEPVAFYHPRNGFYWAKPTHISAPTVVDVEPLPLYAAAERNK